MQLLKSIKIGYKLQLHTIGKVLIINSRGCSVRKDLSNNSNISPEIRKTILYSSVLDYDEKLQLGFKRKKILENIIEAENKKNKIINVSVKPFPLSLRALGADINLETLEEQTKDKTDDLLTLRRNKEPIVTTENWMNDYEFFEGEEDSQNYVEATADIKIPASKIPCNGCGANLHCADSALPGFIPCEIFKGRTDAELRTIICQRCHFLKNYNIALDVTVKPEDYIKTLSSIQDQHALAILIIDLLDFPCSIWPDIQKILGTKRPVFVVGNKVDLLPKDSRRYLEHIKKCLTDSVLNAGLSSLNLKNVSLVSAKTGYGIEELINKLHKIWSHKGDVYLVGCANVGKSSIFNALLRSDYCKVEASELIKKATTCPWPGTTLQMLKFPILRPSAIRIFKRYERLFSERTQRHAEQKLRKDQLKENGNIKNATLMGHIGMTFKESKENQDLFAMSKGTNPILTLNENSKDYENSKWCYDTPGVINSSQIHNLLTTHELLLLNPTEMITPRVFRIKKNMTLFLAGLGRLDYVDGNLDYLKISVYSSMKLPLLITNTNHANDLYEKLLGTDLLGIPTGDEERLKKWSKLESSGYIEVKGDDEDVQTYDILLSSAGWIGINLSYDKNCVFKAWTPENRGVVVRSPSLIPFGGNLCGSKIRGSLAYRIGKPFIKE